MSLFQPRERGVILKEIQSVENTLNWLREELHRRLRMDTEKFEAFMKRTRLEGEP